jgi:hypothetical protein
LTVGAGGDQAGLVGRFYALLGHPRPPPCTGASCPGWSVPRCWLPGRGWVIPLRRVGVGLAAALWLRQAVLSGWPGFVVGQADAPRRLRPTASRPSGGQLALAGDARRPAAMLEHPRLVQALSAPAHQRRLPHSHRSAQGSPVVLAGSYGIVRATAPAPARPGRIGHARTHQSRKPLRRSWPVVGAKSSRRSGASRPSVVCRWPPSARSPPRRT